MLVTSASYFRFSRNFPLNLSKTDIVLPPGPAHHRTAGNSDRAANCANQPSPPSSVHLTSPLVQATHMLSPKCAQSDTCINFSSHQGIDSAQTKPRELPARRPQLPEPPRRATQRRRPAPVGVSSRRGGRRVDPTPPRSARGRHLPARRREGAGAPRNTRVTSHGLEEGQVRPPPTRPAALGPGPTPGKRGLPRGASFPAARLASQGGGREKSPRPSPHSPDARRHPRRLPRISRQPWKP